MALEDIAAEIRKVLQTKSFSDCLKFDCGADGLIVLADGTACTEDRDTECTLRLSQENLISLLKGKLNPMMALAMGLAKLLGSRIAA